MLRERSELLVKLFLISEKTSLVFHAGKRKVTLKPEDIQKFRAERGRKDRLYREDYITV